MIIKNDFITKSSSTLYICFIPLRFNIRKYLDYMKGKFEYINSYTHTDKENKIEDLVIIEKYVEIEKVFKDLMNGSIVSKKNYEYEIYNKLLNIIFSNNLCIALINHPNTSCLININSPCYYQRIKNIEARIFNYET